MHPIEIGRLATDALFLVLLMSAPVVGTAALVAFLWGLFQAVTQLQDQTTAFVIKLVVVCGLLLLLLPWLGSQLVGFSERVFEMIVDVR